MTHCLYKHLHWLNSSWSVKSVLLPLLRCREHKSSPISLPAVLLFNFYLNSSLAGKLDINSGQHVLFKNIKLCVCADGVFERWEELYTLSLCCGVFAVGFVSSVWIAVLDSCQQLKWCFCAARSMKNSAVWGLKLDAFGCPEYLTKL